MRATATHDRHFMPARKRLPDDVWILYECLAFAASLLPRTDPTIPRGMLAAMCPRPSGRQFEPILDLHQAGLIRFKGYERFIGDWSATVEVVVPDLPEPAEASHE